MAKIADVQEVSLSLLRPYERNAKIHGPQQIEKLKDSIREFGFLTPCLIDGDLNIIAGHGRVMAAKELGMETVPCVFVEGLTDAQRRAYILADNRLGELGEWDRDLVSIELSGLKELGFDITLTGFDIDEIIFTEDDEPELDATETETATSETRIHPGEIWKLGRHRLMCGDSTDQETVRKLMDGEKADLFLTDPPYNVALGVGDTPEIAKIRRRRTDGLKIENDAMGDEDFTDFLKAAFRNATEAMKEGAAYYCWYASASQKSFQTALEDVGLPPHQILIWVKSSLVLGRQDYQWRHEPCFYGWKEGTGHYFIDLRSLTTVMDNMDQMTREQAIEKLKELCDITTTIYEDKPSASELHPTTKPVNLFRKLIRNSTKEGDLVLDLFGGSGTAIIASEQQNRRCFMMEIDPTYAETVIARWEKLTGREAERL